MIEPQKQVCLVSLGCPKNLVDAEMMLGFLKKDGFGLTTELKTADVIVVNTCAFVEDSKKESIDRLFEMSQYKTTGACKALIATGCLSQRYNTTLAEEMPEVDFFVGTGEFDKLSGWLKDKFSDDLKTAPAKPQIRTLVSENQILPSSELPRILATPKHYSYLKISEGCSHRCSFCIIPHIRGDLKSRTIDSVVREVSELTQQGVKEFNLIAQDLNEFGKDLRDGSNLASLLEALNRVKGDFWLRPHYMYPLEFTDRLIGVLRDSEHIVKYVDMPLQHINDRVMRSMKRGSPSRYVRQVLTKLKNAIPEIAIRTTFIVGYPGETEAEFEELYQFVGEYEFDHVGVFRYSIEEGTTAALLPDQVKSEIKQDRYDRLMQLQQKNSLKKNQSRIGKIYSAIGEGPSADRPGFGQARLSIQAPEIDGLTFIAGNKIAEGEFASVKITQAEEYDLIAEVV